MDKKVEGLTASEKQAERRKFIKKAGKAALTAPAVALLLSAESKQAQGTPPAPSGGLSRTAA